MAPYWESQMDHIYAASISITTMPNPFPPLGRKPRPCMLAIPETVPPPLSPMPLSFFQQFVAKPQPQQQPQLPPQQAPLEPPPQPQPQDRRRRRLWQDDPEPPRAHAPVAGLPEPAEAATARGNEGKIGLTNYGGRGMGMCMGHGISLSCPGLNERKPSSALMRCSRFSTCSGLAERPVAEHPTTASQQQSQHHDHHQQQLLSQILDVPESFSAYDLQSPSFDRRYRESWCCSVDASSLWSSLFSLVCPEPTAPVPAVEPRLEACHDVVLDVQEFEVARKERFVPISMKDAVPVSREAVTGPSPMSVLTPTASEPSPTQPLAPLVW